MPIPPEIDCGRPYVRFHEQLRQDNAAKDARVYYPCSSTLMGDDIRYIHARPVLEWLHATENEGANARVGIFTSSGDADAASIETAYGSPRLVYLSWRRTITRFAIV